MRNEESKLQQSCITWFRLQYPRLVKLLFAVPNGFRRDVVTGAILKREGVVTGVADLILLIPKKGYASLCIEMEYMVCRSLEEFIRQVDLYLSQL